MIQYGMRHGASAVISAFEHTALYKQCIYGVFSGRLNGPCCIWLQLRTCVHKALISVLNA